MSVVQKPSSTSSSSNKIIELARIIDFTTTSVTSNFLPSYLTIQKNGLVRITVILSTPAKLYLRLGQNGNPGTEFNSILNKSQNLLSDTIYVFEIPLSKSDAINFRSNSTLTVRELLVQLLENQ